MRLSGFRALSFDCYGTLIDWEAGITEALRPALHRAGVEPDAALEAFARHEAAQQAATPAAPYPAILAATHRALLHEWGLPPNEPAARAFGGSVPDWPAFPDSAPALAYLARHFRLIVLSNVDNTSFAASQARLGTRFDAVFTAQDIGSYKPDPNNFRFLLHHAGVPPHQLLHTAQSLFHDHAPAQAAGLRTAWIDRRQGRPGSGATSPQPGATYDVRFPTLAAMAEAHAAELAAG